MVQKTIISIMLLCMIVLLSGNTYADGARDFEWDDMPYVLDGVGDGDSWEDIIKVAWLPDVSNNKFYIMLQISDSQSKNNKWDAYVDIIVSDEIYFVNISTNTKNGKAKFTIYDGNYRKVYKGTGTWISKDNYIKLDLPLSLLVNNIKSGFSFDMVVSTDSDLAPDDGVITVTTISTFPSSIIFLAGATILSAWLWQKRVYKL